MSYAIGHTELYHRSKTSYGPKEIENNKKRAHKSKREQAFETGLENASMRLSAPL